MSQRGYYEPCQQFQFQHYSHCFRCKAYCMINILRVYYLCYWGEKSEPGECYYLLLPTFLVINLAVNRGQSDYIWPFAQPLTLNVSHITLVDGKPCMGRILCKNVGTQIDGVISWITHKHTNEKANFVIPLIVKFEINSDFCVRMSILLLQSVVYFLYDKTYSYRMNSTPEVNTSLLNGCQYDYLSSY